MRRVLFLDDDRRRQMKFAEDPVCSTAMYRDFAPDARSAIVMLIGALQDGRPYTDIHLDHDLCEEDQNKREGFIEPTGYEVALWLAERPEVFPDASIVVHTLNRWGANRMCKVLEDAGRKPVWIPFGTKPGEAGQFGVNSPWIREPQKTVVVTPVVALPVLDPDNDGPIFVEGDPITLVTKLEPVEDSDE